MAGRVSQRDIANRLNISVATVSRSLRNDRAIHPETRARVLDEAARLGYRLPDGRSPDRSSVRTVQAFLSQEPQLGVAAEQILAGVSEAAEMEHLQVSIHMVDPAAVGELIEPDGRPVGMRAGLVDGALLMMHLPDEIVRVISMNVPCVSIVHRFSELGLDSVDCNPVLAFCDLVERLAADGHTRIGFVGRGLGVGWEARCFCGFRAGLFRTGVALDEGLLLGVDQPLPERGAPLAAAVHGLLDRGATALLCTADQIAVGVRGALGTWTGHSEREVAVAAYGGGPIARACPGLMLAAVPYRDLGIAAVRRLSRRITDRSEQQRHILVRHRIETVQDVGPGEV